MVSWPLPGQQPTHTSPSGPATVEHQQVSLATEPLSLPTEEPTSPRRAPLWVLLVAVAVAAAAVVMGAAWFVWPEAPTPVRGLVAAAATTPTKPASTPAASRPAVRSTAPTLPRAAKPSTAADATEKQSRMDLSGLRQDSLGQVTLDGSWVAMLSAKSVGITDPLAVAANGSHRFLGADILKEHLQLRADSRFAGARIFLLNGTDFGRRSTYLGRTLWITFATGSFYDAQSVKDFCQTAYPGKSGKALANVCVARTLTPSH
jgi:hypothetical protein